MLNSLQWYRRLFSTFFSLKQTKGDPKHEKGTQIPKKVPMGTRVPKRGPIGEQWWWVTNGNRFSSNPKLGKLMFWWMQKYFPMQLDFLAKVQRILAMSKFTPLFTYFRSNSQSVLFNATPNLKHSGIFATSTCVAILKTVTLNFQHTITQPWALGLICFA